MKIITLNELERERKKVVSKFFMLQIYAFLKVFFVLSFAFLIVLTQFLDLTRLNFITKLFILIPFLIFLIYGFKREYLNLMDKRAKVFRSLYKEKYLFPYLKNKNINYKMNAYINTTDIVRSRLFKSFTHQRGNDMITGEIEDVRFSFSDLILEKKKDITFENDMRLWAINFLINYFSYRYERDKTHLFTGILFIADFNKNIKSNTFIMSHYTPRDKKGLSLITLDNPIFNDKFKVFSDDIQNAFYLLTPAFMERVLNLQSVFNCEINISFIKTKIYIAINKGFDSFEADINKPIVKQDPAKVILDDLNALFGIVKVLALDKNLWANLDDL
ncbi:DUF3137 domain-containing protein [Campylobacter ureolyticus]|uniref:DUF3137 domain-containing membrane protein n=1 Tax=Campylobacter ureolyticus TaxID=827 RepID=A0AAE7JNF3_9BACT|nr:DUF3137 domain-containing protein [Campylobacter ureolyticus]MCR8685416.1 DUF3137 domain-containing protein [Campylobacter ureolyticus]QKF83547.1 DUF3137 domain-containing membrane protein [Campylobacter ureolyticus]QQY36292.1 DUF3137 domain-containing protein [Campylobacter ureolyticus]SUX25308.1 putative Galanin [Campylobacter ureolyticus]